MSDPLEVILVEDHLTVRKGLELVLRAEGMHVAGVAAGVHEARHLLERRRHDVVLLDMNLSDGNALGLVRERLEREPGRALVIHTGESDPRSLQAALESGARGFVLKSASPATLIAALRQVAAGGVFIDPALTRTMSSGSQRLRRLSQREREILHLLADGMNGEEIARSLVISPETVRTHVRNAMTKLGARTRTHAVALAVATRSPV